MSSYSQIDNVNVNDWVMVDDKERPPQFNDSNMSSNQAADTSAAELAASFDNGLHLGPGQGFNPAFDLHGQGDYSGSHRSASAQSQSTETATTSHRTARGTNINTMGTSRVLPANPNRGRLQDRSWLHREDIQLTRDTLEMHNVLVQEHYPHGVEAWLAGGGVQQRLTGHGVPSLSESLWAHRPSSSKPSIVSSGYRDCAMVSSPNGMAESIAAVGSRFDNEVIDARLDIRYLEFHDFHESM